MKILVALGFWALSLTAKAQQPAVPVLKQLPPAIFVDSERVEGLYFDPKYIDGIHVGSGSDTTIPGTRGRIDITMKKPGLHLVSLKFVSNGLGVTGDRKILYIIDGNPVKDTALVRIDYGYIAQSRLVNPSDIPYLGVSGEKISLVLISTRHPIGHSDSDHGFLTNTYPDPADTSRSPIIHIRGI
jgi:hypothetical protein